MSQLTKFDADASETENTDFYLPAAAVSPDFDYICNAVGDLFNFHGVALTSDTYDK